MRVSSRFPIAVHTLMLIAAFGKNEKVNSSFVSRSTGVNPVVIRNIFSQLKRAGLISVSRGPGGTALKKEPETINLWDIFKAVESVEPKDIFSSHENPSPYCPVGGNIFDLLQIRMEAAVDAMEHSLSSTTIGDMINDLLRKVPDLNQK